MRLHTHRLARAARPPQRCPPWRRRPAPLRPYSAATASTATAAAADDPPWFRDLRREMLSRPMAAATEFVNSDADKKLEASLSPFLPPAWRRRVGSQRPRLLVPLGHSLLWFNTCVPVDQLLPDGTDPLQSPGGPWVRRMWAGGRMEVNKSDYYSTARGFAMNATMVSAERIADVQLRGSGDAAKILVTLERRFARAETLRQKKMRGVFRVDPSPLALQRDFCEQTLHQDWGDAILKDERNLVFLNGKTPEEMEAIRAGEFVPVRYLDPPGKPDFSHALTPTRALLFRYSALTFNAHLIHLDRDYARNVEGHRNLLVHGPLSLTLMLHAISGHVRAQTRDQFVVESIKYRNLAPLYCDEEMRLCGMQKDSDWHGATYHVWIEGPTGGVAVKGTVRTMRKPPIVPRLPGVDFRRIPLVQQADAGQAQSDTAHVPAFHRRLTDFIFPQQTLHYDASEAPGSTRMSNKEKDLIMRTLTSSVGEPAEPGQKELSAPGRDGHTGNLVRRYIRRDRVAASNRKRRNQRRSGGRELPRMFTPKVASPPATPRVMLSKFTILPSVKSVSSLQSPATDSDPKAAHRQATTVFTQEPPRAHHRNRPGRRDTSDATSLPIRQIRTTSPSIVRAVQSRTRQLGERKERVANRASLIHKYGSSPYATVLARHSTFERHGPRKIEKVRIRLSERAIRRRPK
ncbi:hypothetical protein BDU57DRAFT_269555 [Ampelomyces quisqualis]|uniref:HotDog domain-containing protein n=1 Tax=Ampelomyces quisqualis TaxID=50730 RepID=A0A6A5QHS4_AMPQU|nr:hypothetical protein BDU57DRAFT_269555 [Ampelomyces quisqualis]